MWGRARDSFETDTRGLTPPFFCRMMTLVQTKHMSNNTTVNSGMGLGGWLTILFVGLKLTGQITWPWVWVLSPLWISALIFLAIVAVILIFAIIGGAFK